MTAPDAPAPPARSIEYVPLDDVRPADRNPKRHDHATIRSSIERFGFVEPMIRDDRTGRLVAGHGRVDELRQARARDPLAPPDGVIVDDDGTWLVPIVVGWSSSDEHEAEAYVVASNRLVEVGGWDDLILVDVLNDLAEQGDAAMIGIGYDVDDALAMLSAQIGQLDDDVDVDTDPQLGDRLVYRVIVDCADEDDQTAIMQQLDALGLPVRAVVN